MSEFVDVLAGPDRDEGLDDVIKRLGKTLVSEISEDALRTYVLTGQYPEGTKGKLALTAPNASAARGRNPKVE